MTPKSEGPAPDSLESAGSRAREHKPLKNNTIPGQQNQAFCAGYGQWHSPNNPVAPRPYASITMAEIEAMAADPRSIEKDQAQWGIFSTMLSRVHSEQREQGRFVALWADVDEPDGLTFSDILDRVERFLPAFIAYTSRSATQDRQKCRIIAGLAAPVSGAEFILLQKILNNKLQAAGITPDRATERAGQVCYLPNKGEFYSYAIDKSTPLDVSAWADDVAAEQQRQRAEEQAKKERRDQAKVKAAQRVASGDESPIDAFNAAYDLPLMLDSFGYVERGRKWLSPNSESGVPGVTITDDGRKWLSAHGSDAGIGASTNNGTMGDAFDLFVFYQHHGDRDQAIRAAAEMFGCEKTEEIKQSKLEKPGVNLICAAGIIPEPVKWLWPGWLAAGKLHILAGAPGTGKSTLAFALGATITIGGRWPHGSQADPGEVLIWSGEDDPADTIVPRLLACGADLKRVHLLGGITGPEPRPFDPAVDMPALRATMTGRNVQLMIVDPVVSAVGADSNSNGNAEVRRSLQPLVDLAAATGCAVLGISHFSKGTAGRDPVERVTGSLAFGALARVVLATAKLPEEEYDGARLLARAKSNIGPDTGGFHYHMEQVEVPGHPGITNTRILWGKAVDGAARDLLAVAEHEGGENKSATAAAAQWLTDLLGTGAMMAAEVTKEARAAGIAPKPLRAAREKLGIKPKKIGFPGCWWWCLEDAQLPKMPEDTHSPEKGTFGE